MAEDKVQSPLWDCLDGCVVINLDTRPERYEAFIETVAPVLPASKIHRISAVNGRELPSFGKAPWFTEATGSRANYWGGAGGCVLSHRNAIAYARSRNWRNVLIFEDDATLEKNADVISLLKNTFPSLNKPYLLYLGYNKPSPYGVCCAKHGEAALWKTGGVIAAHAYVVSAELYDALLAVLPAQDDDVWGWLARYRAIDVLYRDYVQYWRGVTVYVVYPILFVQNDAYSDILMGAPEGPESACWEEPRSVLSPKGIVYICSAPVRRLKIWLNSIRTRRRARRKGLPGYRREKE